ncbi:MAG: hypothetical protein LBT79_02000 [Elusimicrobiota bacterium]|jgi:hypothetical protein|nr:hypothetical protein [Elusimicrobiota bacterium]
MSVVFDPSAIIKRVLPKDGSDLLTKDTQFKDKFKKSLLRLDWFSGKDLNKAIDKTLTFYKGKMQELKGEGVKTFKSEAINGGKLLEARVSDLVIEKASEDIKERYAGAKYIWLPSDADVPDSDHMLKYGQTFIVGDGEQPGERYGCRCGMEILTDEASKDTPDTLKLPSNKKNLLKEYKAGQGGQITAGIGKSSQIQEKTQGGQENGVNGAVKETKTEKYPPLADEYIDGFTKDKFTSKETGVAKYYTGTGYKNMNFIAKGDEVSTSANKEWLMQERDNIKTLQAMIEKNELPQTMLYRFLKREEIEAVFKEVTNNIYGSLGKIGNRVDREQAIEKIKKAALPIEYKQFVSTTRDKTVEFGETSIVKLNIKVPKGTKGLPLEHISSYGINRGAKNEKEVLLNIGTKLKIEDVRFNESANYGYGRFEVDVIVVN